MVEESPETPLREQVIGWTTRSEVCRRQAIRYLASYGTKENVWLIDAWTRAQIGFSNAERHMLTDCRDIGLRVALYEKAPELFSAETKVRLRMELQEMLRAVDSKKPSER
jgi:hypothetical protein